MSNTNTEVLTTAYEKLQEALTQSNTVLPKLQEAIEKGNLDNYATTSDLEEKANKTETTQLSIQKANQSDLNVTNSNVSKNTTDIATQKARIDAFTALSSGSTTGDAELADGKIGADGVTYANIGGAIRGQVKNLTNSVDANSLYDDTFVEYEIGSLSNTDGTDTTSTTNIRTKNYIHCKKGSRIIVNTGYTVSVAKFSLVGKGFISMSKEVNNFTLDEDCYIRFVIRGANGNIKTAQNNIVLKLISTSVQEKVNTINSELNKYTDIKRQFKFVSSALVGGVNTYTTSYSPNSRIASTNFITLDYPIIVSLSSYELYKFGIYYTTDNIAYTDTGWITKNYVINAGTSFKIVVGLVTVDESKNNFEELYNALTIKNYYNLDRIKELVNIEKEKPRRELLTLEQGSVSSTGNVTSTTRCRSGFIHLNKGDIIYSNNQYCWFSVHKYDLAKNYVSNIWGWDTVCDNGSKGSVVLKYVADEEQYVKIVVRSNDNITMNEDTIEEYRHYIIVCNEKGEKQYKYQKLESNGLNVVLHRGYSAVAPENTVYSFREGIRRGFKEMETDIWFTSDNVPVICHDSTIDRTSNGTGTIANMTLAELKQFDFGSWKNSMYAGAKILTLEELLIDAKKYGYRLQLEPKESWTTSQAQIIVDIVKKYNMEKCVSFGGFNGYSLQYVHNLCDSIDLKRSVTEITTDTINATLALKSDNNNVTMIISASNVTDDMLSLAKDNNISVHVYFANNISTYEGYVSKYIAETTTDYLNPTEYYFGV